MQMDDVKGLSQLPVAAENDVTDLLVRGFGNQTKAPTGLNVDSSRGHTIFTLDVVKIVENPKARKKSEKRQHVHTRMKLVDLAGSERVKKSEVTGDGMKEAQNINKSLSSLGTVMAALQNKDKHIPFRDSKLTLLLADSLGGNSKTFMFVNISPADYNADETQTALVYASRVKMITNVAKKESDSTIVAHLKKIVDEFVTNGVSTTFNKKGLVPHDGNAGDAATGD